MRRVKHLCRDLQLHILSFLDFSEKFHTAPYTGIAAIPSSLEDVNTAVNLSEGTILREEATLDLLIRGVPFSLFDEIEKGHISLYNTLKILLSHPCSPCEKDLFLLWIQALIDGKKKYITLAQELQKKYSFPMRSSTVSYYQLNERATEILLSSEEFIRENITNMSCWFNSLMFLHEYTYVFAVALVQRRIVYREDFLSEQTTPSIIELVSTLFSCQTEEQLKTITNDLLLNKITLQPYTIHVIYVLLCENCLFSLGEQLRQRFSCLPVRREYPDELASLLSRCARGKFPHSEEILDALLSVREVVINYRVMFLNWYRNDPFHRHTCFQRVVDNIIARQSLLTTFIPEFLSE